MTKAYLLLLEPCVLGNEEREALIDAMLSEGLLRLLLEAKVDRLGKEM